MISEKTAKDIFFNKMDRLGLALTYDDVRLRTGHSEVPPDEVNTETFFSRNVRLKIPIVSAAMDTVTEYKLAIAMAQLGGIGVIHKNITPEEQARQVAKVKFYLNGFIEKPICVRAKERIGDVFNRNNEKGYKFTTFPVINNNGRLVGILTGGDIDFNNDPNLRVTKVMTQGNLIVGHTGLDLKQAYDLMQEEKKKILPIVDSEGIIQGMYVWSDVKRIIRNESKMFNLDDKNRLRVAAAIGVGNDAFERLEKLIPAQVDVVVIDTAHADSKMVIDTLKEIKRKYSIDVVVGNISEADSAMALAKAGADGIKIGQGPGSICTTRVIAGIGCPQVTAVYECSKVADKFKIPTCADGGLKYSGDIPIAIGAGASNVMMGSMLAGTDEAPGEIIFRKGMQWKIYRGMGSIGAMETNKESRARYLQGDTGKNELIPEGIEGLSPYKGKLKQVLFQYVGGLKRGMGYVGAATIPELKKKANFKRITNAGLAESHPHNVEITEDPPNYTRRH